MKVVAVIRSRRRRALSTSAVVVGALFGLAVDGFDAPRAVAQTGGSVYADANAPQAAPPKPASPPTPTASDSQGNAGSSAPQKSAAALKLETFYSAKNPDVVGEPLALERLLNGVYSPSERYRRLAAYWDLAGRRAYCNLCVECAIFASNCAARVQKKYEGATVPPETAALVAASRLVALQRREAARLDFARNQRAFDAAFSSAAARRASWVRRSNEARTADATTAEKTAATVGTPTSPILYVPSDAPSLEPYETRFDEMSRRRRLSLEAARLNASLPLLYDATQSRAEQARAEMSALNAAFNASETSEIALFAALDRYLAASREALAAATRYNRAIAAYVAETVPGTLQGAALLATLNRRTKDAEKTVVVRKTFVAENESPVASADYVAPAADANAPAVASVSFVEPAPKPDLTPTPGARLEPADASSPAPLEVASETPSASAEPLPTQPEAPAEPAPAQPEAPAEPAPAPTEAPAEPAPAQPEAPAEPAPAPTEAPAEPAPAPTETPAEPAPAPTETPAEPAPAPTETPAAANGPSTLVVTGYERNAAPTPPPAAEPNETPGAALPNQTFRSVAAVERIVRGQEPEPAAETPEAARPAPPARPTQKPEASAAPSSDRVGETVAALFATAKPEPSPNGGQNAPLEVATTLRATLARVSAFDRAATAEAYWRLQGASARLAVENEILKTLTQAFNELNAKSAGSEPARLYLAAALGAQARAAEARAAKRDAQIALARRLRWNLNEGWPIPSTLPFAGPTYRLETPVATTNPTLALEGAAIPENLKAIRAIGAAFGPPATLCRFDVPPTSAADPLVALATLEKKRESILLFVELVVATNVSIADYVASYPAGFVASDRYVDALVGEGK